MADSYSDKTKIVEAIPGGYGGTLHPYPPGVSGNPKGRPKKARSLTALLKHMLKKKVDITDKDGNVILRVSKKTLMLLKYIEKATDGDPKVVEGILDRIEGKAKTSGEITLKNGMATLSDDELKKIAEKSQ